jgi:Terminase RNaseH-like domain/Terminase large subunit, T4likevirus-type, N-terminal
MPLLRSLKGSCDRLRQEQYINVPDFIKTCTFDQFVPNAGAQARVFEHIPLDGTLPITTPYQVIYYRGGINSGKSFAGAAFICANAQRDPEARQLITANSYGQLETSTLVVLAEFCKHYAIPLYPIAAVDMEAPDWADLTAKKIANARFCTVFGAPILALSAEAFTGRTSASKETGRGLKVRAFWGDEFAYADRSAFTTLLGRLNRGPGTMKGIGLLTSSINKNDPYNWAYDLFDDPDRDEQKQKFYYSISGSTSENIYAEADFVEQQMSALTAELALIELQGEYAKATDNLVYHPFDRTLNASDAVAQDTDTLHIGVDFNIGKMAAVVHIIREGLPIAVDEFYGLKDSPALIESIKDRYKDRATRTILLYPDATAQYSRTTTNAGLSDIKLLKDAGFKIVVNSINPMVRDRVNAMNAMFLNAKGDRRYKVNISKCKVYVKCLERQITDKKGLPYKPKDDQLSHILDAGGYFIVKRFPVVAQGLRRGPQLY